MKHECAVVEDLLPLYLEHMVREETAQAVAEHLDSCEACRTKYMQMQDAGQTELLEEEEAALRTGSALALAAVRKKLKKRAILLVLVAVLCAAALGAALRTFPVYHMAKVWYPSYFTTGEISMLAYRGSKEDRAIGEKLVRQAEEAMGDLTHTEQENRQRYGLLARYATDGQRGAVSERHTIDLWSAHLNATDGYLWVYYSIETSDIHGDRVWGSWDIPSLWYVEKDEQGQWQVQRIKEHP